MFDFEFFLQAIVELLKAVPLTIYLTVLSFFVGLVLAVIMAIIRYKEVPVLDKIVSFYVSFIRGTPIMLQLYLVYYILPYLIVSVLNQMGIEVEVADFSTKLLVIVALALNIAGFLAETIRGGLNALGKSEIEAAYSIGMTTSMVYKRVILPQVTVLCIPNFSSNIINILHASSLAYFVSLLEVTGTAKILAHNNWNYFEAFAASGVIYWVLTMLIEVITYAIEKIVERRGYSLSIR